MASIIHPEKKGASRIRDKRSQRGTWVTLGDDEEEHESNNTGKKREKATTSSNTTSISLVEATESQVLRLKTANARRIRSVAVSV